MKFIKFPQATGYIPVKQLIDGMPAEGELCFYLHDGFLVYCGEFSKDDLKELKQNGGRFHIILGPGIHNALPITAQVQNPFAGPRPAGKIIDLNPIRNEDQTQESTSDDQQYNDGNNKPDQ